MTGYPNPSKGIAGLRMRLSDDLPTERDVTLEYVNHAGVRQEFNVTSAVTGQDLEVSVDLGA